MPNEEKHRSGQHPPYIDESLIINTRLKEVERHQQEEKAEDKEYKRRQLNFTRWTVLFTASLVLTSCISDWILFRQTAGIKESADAAKRAADTADKSLSSGNDSFSRSFEQMKRQSDNTESLAKAANTQIAKLQDAVNESRALVRVTRESMSANEGHFIDNLVATRDSFRVANRAYLGVNDARASIPEIKTGAPTASPFLAVHIVNTGNTPARGVHGWAKAEFRKDFVTASYLRTFTPSVAELGIPSNRDVPKDGSVDYTRTFSFASAQFVDLLNGQQHLMIYGFLQYTDIFGADAQTGFCFWYNKMDDMSACPGDANTIR